jgi:hypothetical protein
MLVGNAAQFAEVRLVAQMWLGAGNSLGGGNVMAFFLDLWEHCACRRWWWRN